MPRCRALLINQAEATLREQGAHIIWGLFSVPPGYQNLLRQAGFFKALLKRTRRPFHLVADFVSIEQFRPDLFDRDGPLFQTRTSLVFSLGDTDLA